MGLRQGHHLAVLQEVSRVQGHHAEEAAVGLVEEVEFSLEDALKQKGAVYECSENWKEKVVVDGRLASGQNPASARALATAIVNLLK